MSEPSHWLPLSVFAVFIVMAVGAPLLAPYGPAEVVRTDGSLVRLSPPSFAHPFGTTSYGHDVLSQVIWGSRRALVIGGSAAAVALLIGVNVGLVAGYLRGPVDAVLMRITDMAFALPFLPLAIVLIGLFGRSDLTLLLVIGFLFWRTTARVVRSQVLSVKERTFVQAARVAGASAPRVLFRHIAPNVFNIAALYGILLISEAVLAEAMLSFLGLAPAGSTSWGTVMNAAFNSGQLRIAWWWAFFPGLFITLFVLATSLLGVAYEKSRRLRGEER
ncbi:ABC transporter permease [Aeromicrobium sp. CTD01-1L150]|uniref:ABC transporter permease n=1 Tax=Aeromicrobium sp. CTD01-1L150 TaxID=3341830 RepID=UPI0035BFB8C2